MHKISYVFFIGIICFSSCSARKKTTTSGRNTISNRDVRRNNSSIQKANSASIAGYKSLSSLDYIDRFKAIAVQEMNEYGIPASITLAQGLFESGAGNSDLAISALNAPATGKAKATLRMMTMPMTVSGFMITPKTLFGITPPF
jgi:uncharacterized FlgJ-related protein